MAVGTTDACASARAARPWPLALVRTAATVLALTAACTAMGDQRTLYKSVLPSGEVVYADSPQPGAKRTDELLVEPHPPNAQATQAAQRDLTAMREQLLRDADARAARGQQLDRDIASAAGQLRDAQARQEQARNVQEGDRQGRRLVGPFWQRQQMLANEVQRARQALNALQRERAALQ
ncbi:DUF4124 domain-containing protein [Variovorax sp. NFACC27]|jgi:hypothetical protein